MHTIFSPSPKNFPPTLVHVINFPLFLLSLSSAVISKDAGLICGGFEDSSIVLWSLTPKKLVRPKSKPEISKVQLAPGM